MKIYMGCKNRGMLGKGMGALKKGGGGCDSFTNCE